MYMVSIETNVKNDNIHKELYNFKSKLVNKILGIVIIIIILFELSTRGRLNTFIRNN